MPRRLLCAVVALTALAGCGKSVEEMEAVAVGMAGVVEVHASRESGDGLPFVTQFPADVRVTMAKDVTEGEIRDVTASYEGDVEDGDVERLSVVLQGEPRSTLATSGGAVGREGAVDAGRAQAIRAARGGDRLPGLDGLVGGRRGRAGGESSG